MLPALSGLVDKSIVTAADGADGPGPRYRMLETVRAYALDRPAEAGEEAAVPDAFTAHYLNLAETADPMLRAAGQGPWLRELTSEQDNLHAALRWTTAGRDADAALRFVRALGWYWMLRGQHRRVPRETGQLVGQAAPGRGAGRLGPAPVDADRQRSEHDEDAERPEQGPNGRGRHRAAGE